MSQSHKTALVIILGLLANNQLLSVRGDESKNPVQSKKINSTTSMLLEGTGYTSVPMKYSQASGLYYVEGMYYGNKLTFLVDTGCNGLVLNEAKAKALTWPVRNTGRKVQGLGGERVAKEAFVYGVSVGSVDLSLYTWTVPETSDLSQPFYEGSGTPCDGIIGSRMLKYYSAVMDLPTSKLLLLDPILQESDLQGDWEVTEDRYRGMLTPLDDRPTRITVKGSKLSMGKDGDKTSKDYYLQLERNATPKAMDWIGDDGKTITASYDIAGGVWTLALPDPTAKAMVRPNKLISEKGDTFTTYKLAKVKPLRLTPQEK